MKKFILTFAVFCGAGAAQAGTLTDMVDHIGAYPADIKLFGRAAFKARVMKLLGKTYFDLLTLNTTVQSPITGTRIVSYFSGIRAHMGGVEVALFVYDASSDAVKVWIKTAGKVVAFDEYPFVNYQLFSKDLNAEINLLYR